MLNVYSRESIVIYITEHFFERVQLYIKGYTKNSISEKLNLKLMNIETNEIISPQSFQMTDNKFEIRFNIVIAYNGNYIPSGKYKLVDESSINVKVRYDQSLFENNVRSYNRIFYNYKKNKNEYYALQLQENVKEYQLNIDFVTDFKTTIKSLPLNTIIRQFRDKLFHFVFILVFLFGKLTKSKKSNLVLFTSDSRASLTGNMLYVYDKMLELKLDKQFSIKYAFKEHLSSRRKFLDKMTFPFLLAKADYIIVDDYHPLLYNVKFSKEQEVVQLWHACGTFKTVGFSRLGKPDAPFIDSRVHRNYTKSYVSSNSDIMYYAEAFGIKEENVIPTGVPRTDIFFDKKYANTIRQKFLRKYTYMQNKRIILFAPTFRGGGHKSAYYPQEMLDFDRLASYCKSKNAIVLFKFHPFVREKIKIPGKYSLYIKDFSSYREVNDLLFLTDILVTDYSSLIYEYSILNGKMLFFAFDLDAYITSRDFYQEYESFVPGKVVKTIDELMDALYNEDFESYKVQPFYEKNFKYRDGKSSERVVRHLFRI